jgi:hypothetical protein
MTKYVIIVPDGAADEPIEELGNETALEAAEIPNMDKISTEGRQGIVRTIPKGLGGTTRARFIPAERQLRPSPRISTCHPPTGFSDAIWSPSPMARWRTIAPAISPLKKLPN